MLVRGMLSAACLAVWHLDGAAVLILAVGVVALRLVVAKAERLFAVRDLQVLHGTLQLLCLVLVDSTLRPVRAVCLACFAGAFPGPPWRARRRVGCMRCGRHRRHAGPCLHEVANVASHVRHLMQCFIEAVRPCSYFH